MPLRESSAGEPRRRGAAARGAGARGTAESRRGPRDRPGARGCASARGHLPFRPRPIRRELCLAGSGDRDPHRESSVQFGEILAIPWLMPGLGVSLVMAFILGGPVERTLRAGPLLGWALIVSLGIILSATLTPSPEAIDSGASGIRGCDLSRIGLAPIRELLRLGDTGLNVLMFVPLGAAIGLLPPSGRRTAIIVAAIALPFAIEAIQALVPWLDRACESADVVDNLTGLAIGLGGGVVAGRLAGAVDRRPR